MTTGRLIHVILVCIALGPPLLYCTVCLLYLAFIEPLRKHPYDVSDDNSSIEN